ncbi:PREDICTED: odorant receptor 85f-like, partial [Dinoponera quadriceps]|uniref:Odorant receptor 85f-like n=1 Tax=Dinoponera quadriceps TaxID=609295 RepID=A0A6P3WQG2_DINQU
MDMEHYKINRLVMSWIGQWPEQTGFSRIFLSFNLIFAVSSQLCLQMKNLLIEMRNSWNLATLNAQIQILRKYTDKGKKLTKIYAAIMYSSMSMYMTLPIIPSIVAFFTNANQTQMYGLLYHVETIFNVERYYYFILLHSYYTTFFLMTIPVATDSMLVIYVQHACGLFEAIGYQLENIKQNDRTDINIYPQYKDDEHYRIISDSAAKHIEVLQFSKLLTSTYSISLLILTILNVAVMTFSGLVALININRPLEAFRYAVTCLCLTMHFLFLSMPGQQLIDHSSNVYESIYAVKWYAISVRARKLLNLMLIRCRTPCQITAGKMSIMSLKTFST